MLDEHHDSVVSSVLLRVDDLATVNRCFRLNTRMRVIGADQQLMLRWIERHRGPEAAFMKALDLHNTRFARDMIPAMDTAAKVRALTDVVWRGVASLVAPLVDPTMDINARVPHEGGSCIIHLATDTETLAALLRVPGIDVNVVDNLMATALHYASMSGELNNVKLLLAMPDILPNLTDNVGRTALHYAVTSEVASVLLAAPGINVNPVDVRGRTPLHLNAIDCNETSIIDVLISAPGINVNARDSTGRTPLHFAVQHVIVNDGPLDCVRALIAAPGIDVNITDVNGRSPLDMAMNASRTDVRDLLWSFGKINADGSVTAHTH